MSDGIYTALSGAIAQERSLDVVANNVANANTTGFRADRVAFHEALSQANARAGRQPQGVGALRYVALDRVEADTTPGAIQRTGNTYDFALEGDGYFTIRTPDGERMTRAGTFTTDAQGVLRTREGAVVLGEGGDDGVEIRIPQRATRIEVSGNGEIRADDQLVGRMRIRRVEGGVTREGATTFAAVQGANVLEAGTTTSVVQGSLEGANVNAIHGVTDLISVTRAFEAAQRVIQSYQTIDERAARDLGSR